MARRTKAEIEAFDAALFRIAERVQPATARQIYYRAVVTGLVPKTQKGYRRVCESLARQRWAGELPWEWIADETRAVRVAEQWANAGTGFEAFAAAYRRDVWREQPSWVEVWVESDSLAGTLIDTTWPLGVPLFSGRGFASLSSLRIAAEQIDERYTDRKQRTVVLYVGDLDPSGWEASRAAHRLLQRHLDSFHSDAKHGALEFVRLAVNPDDVETYELEVGDSPKRGGPGRTSWWTEDGPQLNFTVEAEAFEPAVLRSLVEDAIYEHADRERLERAREVEALERETLLAVARRGVFSDLVRDSGGSA